MRCPLTTGLPTIVFSAGLVFSRHSETVTLNQTYNSFDCESVHPDQLDFTEYWNFTFLYITLKNYVRSRTVPLDQPSWVINMSEPKTLFEAYLTSSLNDIGKHSVWEGWLVVECMVEEVPRTKFKMPITSRSRLSTANNSSYHHCIRRSVFSCRPHCHSCRWSSHSLLSWIMLWYRLYHVFVLIYLIVFITDCFIRKWCTKRILIPSTFVGSFCLSNWFLYLLVGLLSGCLVGCLVICFFGWLVGRFSLVGWF